MWLLLTNQSALCQRSIATLKFLYDIGSRTSEESETANLLQKQIGAK